MARVKLDAPRVLHRKVARLPEVRASVRKSTEGLASLARLFAAAHGISAARITVTSGKVDSFVNFIDDDTGKNEPAAAAIEFGGTFKNGRHQKGLHILGNAVKSARRL